MAPEKEHQPIFNDIIKLATFQIYLMDKKPWEEIELLEPKVKELLTEWWTPLLGKNIDKRGVKEELAKSLAVHILEK